jgi:hypothetical protein
MRLRLDSGLVYSGATPSLRAAYIDGIQPVPALAQRGARTSSLVHRQLPGNFRYWIGTAGYDHDGRLVHAVQGLVLTDSKSPSDEGAFALRLYLGYNAVVRRPNFGTMHDPVIDLGGINSTLDRYEREGEFRIGAWFWSFLVVTDIR